MKETPILMSAPMVRAILEERKTQTRRVLMASKLPDGLEEYEFSDLRLVDGFLEGRKNADSPFQRLVHGQGRAPECKGIETRCPYGEPGDRLWVKETFVRVPGSPESLLMPSKMFPGEMQCSCIYRESASANPATADFAPAGGWRPSIFMPRWASRITLEIVSVRVERVQDISESDALAEGISVKEYDGRPKFGIEVFNNLTARDAYWQLWDSINAKRGFGWEVNPWVWVIEFRRLELANQ